MSDLRFFLESVPDPRSRRGRWYSLTSILLVCAAAAVSGARTIDELAEWGARADAELLATLGVPSLSALGETSRFVGLA
ncbi:transposase family protein [Streptomyces sp. NBC_01754]|uniref:transposase family protein n=1 Tax=Streptomyces sp. NBC_01754 TaxID=2975930 RepID=UPI002DD89A2A|nr:transposase family protein [Streptomyces sp. NBC_01754]WSC92175.1 transposase family protein [Streptomyces sp. NBC_01754]